MINNFYLMHVKRAFQSFAKNGVYWVDKHNASKVPPPYADFYPATILKPYTNQPNLVLVRSGGIGDIIALSALTGIADNTIILTQDKFKPLADYFDYPVVFKGFNDPLFMVKFPQTMQTVAANYAMMYGEQVIENGSTQNWFEILYQSINITLDGNYEGRPLLKTQTTDVNDCCLIVAAASCINRTADKQMLVNICSRYFATIVVADEQHWTFTQYLQQLDKAKFVVSVDTSAIHFREGVGKPALGIYGAFTAKSRTKYYTFTKSIDVSSQCPLQPCFKHSNEICPFVQPPDTAAPCLHPKTNTTLYEQIDTAIKQYADELQHQPLV